MSAPRIFSAALLFAGLVTGTLSDAPRTSPPLNLGGYRVLAADFHVHAYPFSASTLAPWDLVLEAERQGLDAIAITPHNHIAGGRAARWFSRLVGGPTVLVGEEIHAPQYHMIAVGIHSTVSWHGTAAESIEEVHRQGGVAIAAHPVASAWAAYDGQALARLDGAEVQQPIVYGYEFGARELDAFFRRGHFTAVGSSDFHGPGPLGLCRTYVFALENTEAGILEALREHRTVVYARDGRAWGDPQLIHAAAEDGRLPARAAAHPGDGFLALTSRICGVLGLIGMIFCGGGKVYSPKEKESS